MADDRDDFQHRVAPWMMACFSAEIARDTRERNHRFLEEALELVQACGCTKSEAHQLVDYVFGRPAGEKVQEVGGVMVTLAALCLAQDLDMHEAGETELTRIWMVIDKIRAKQEAKPRHSPLPEHPASITIDHGSISLSCEPRIIQLFVDRMVAAHAERLPESIAELQALRGRVDAKLHRLVLGDPGVSFTLPMVARAGLSCPRGCTDDCQAPEDCRASAAPNNNERPE